MDFPFRGNDGKSLRDVIPAKAGIHESRGGRGFPYKRESTLGNGFRNASVTT